MQIGGVGNATCHDVSTARPADARRACAPAETTAGGRPGGRSGARRRGWDVAFEVLCGTLAWAIGAGREVAPGAGRGVRDPALTTHLAAFLARAARSA
jgi:hypothetical protein